MTPMNANGTENKQQRPPENTPPIDKINEIMPRIMPQVAEPFVVEITTVGV
tara:strand:- start:376 stop:528 length:153 start_codon:yes stop_codon:yes gene_type:complete